MALIKQEITFQGMAPLLQVFDMPTSLQFYRDVLQFKLLQSSGEGDDVDWVLLQQSNVEIMLNTAYEKEHRPPMPELQRNKAHADISLHFGCPAIESLYDYLVENGVQATKPEITGYGWKALYLVDPDGYQLCFHWPQEG